jgi:hypothetical protein
MKKFDLEFFKRMGRKGGKARTARKLAAIRANAKKATAARWPKKKARKR